MKMYLSKFGKDARVALLAVCFVGLAVCSSLAEKTSKYYEKGLALMVQGPLLKAAQESYLKAYEAGKPALPLGMAYAELLLQCGQVARAEVVASEILQSEPRNVLSHGEAPPFKDTLDWASYRLGNAASNLREPLRVFQHTGVNLSLVLISLRWSARCGSIAKMI
jgi:hypothetical protein